jgi:hypothetical protein
MDDRLPPKVVNVHARRLQPDEIDPATDLVPVSQTSSLQRSIKGTPVLEAFQRFLEVERRRARNRMIFLTAIFVIILLVAGGVSVIIGNGVYREMRANVKDVQTQLRDVQGNTHQFSQAAALTMRELSTSASERDVALTKLAESSQSRMSVYDDSLGFMRNKMDKLEERDASLLEELDGVYEVLPELSTDLRMIAGMIQGLKPLAPEPEPKVEQERTFPRTYETLTMMIQPEGMEIVVPWRLPIPE